MPPRLIRRKLSSLRWRERGLRLAWRGTLWLLMTAFAVAVALAADWFLDLRDEVPRWLRLGLVVWELSMAGIAVVVLLAWPWSRRLRDDDLALFVEERQPQLNHRLISTVQLNRPGADTRGMSPGLIQRLTSDTEEAVRPLSFAALADHRRLTWAALVVVPLVLIAAGVVLLMPDTAKALLARQMQEDVEIPRRVHLHGVALDRRGELFDVKEGQPLVRPLNDDVVLRFAATGVVDPQTVRGEVRLQQADGRSQSFPLAFERDLGDGRGLYAAKAPQPQGDFTYRAWLDDGRTREVYAVHMEPRPAVTNLDAFVKLPAGYNLDPDTRTMKEGEVVGLEGGTALIRVAVQPGKRLEKATLELLHRPLPGALPYLRGGLGLAPTPLALAADAAGRAAAAHVAAALPEAAARKDLGPEFVAGDLDLDIQQEGNVAFGTFPVRPGLSGYRIRVVDQYGFENVDVPRRSVRVVEDEVPVVELLPERFARDYRRARGPEALVEDTLAIVNDENVRDRSIRLAYRCSDDYGLARAQLRYRRVPRGAESSAELANVDPVYSVTPGLGLLTAAPGGPAGRAAEAASALGLMDPRNFTESASPWLTLPLREYAAGPGVGKFDLDLGVFENIDKFPTAQVEFFPLPPAGPGQWGRLDGGGRFDFQIKAVQNLQPGDRLEFFVEVFDNHPDTARGRRAPGRSEVRVKTMVTEADFELARRQREEQERKLRELEKKQSDVFSKPNRP